MSLTKGLLYLLISILLLVVVFGVDIVGLSAAGFGEELRLLGLTSVGLLVGAFFFRTSDGESTCRYNL